MARVRRGDRTAAQVIGPVLTALVRDLGAAEAEVRLDRPSGVHDFRVSARRLRSVVRATHALLAPDGALLPGLRRAGRAAGAARDVDVTRRRVLALLAAEPPGTAVARLADLVDRDLEGRRRRHWISLVEHLDSPEHDHLTRRLDGFADLPSWSPVAQRPASEVLGPMLDAELQRFEDLSREVERTPRDQLADETLHDLRKQAKVVRYVGDVARPALGEPAKKVRKRVRGVQTVLGELGDALMAVAYLDAARSVPERAAEVRILDRLRAHETAHAAQVRTEFLDGLDPSRRSQTA